jgi:acetolactate synthase-1/2/3 large subunit
MTHNLRGADLVVRTLVAAGVRYVFTLSGNHIMPIFDATIGTPIELVHVRHEGATVHMADAWARLTGEVGIALVTGGPGHANAVGALFTALAAEAPLVLLSGHAPTDELGLGAFQEMSQADLARPVVKAAWTSTDAANLGHDIARAIRTARSGRPGPVHVSLPSDLLDAVLADRPGLIPKGAAFQPTVNLPADADITRLAELLAAAERPLVLAGPQFDTRGHRDLLARIAAAHDVATAVMASPRGLNDPSLGAFAGVVAEADLLVLLGKPLDFTLRFGRPPAIAKTCRIVVVEPDPALLDRAVVTFADRLELAVPADAVPAAERLATFAPSRPSRRRGGAEERISHRPAAWREAKAATPDMLHPAEMCLAIAEVMSRHPDAILVADGGEIGQWAQALIAPSRRVINGVAGSIGAALPFAIAARLAAPGAPVVAVLGDGTFGFHMAEFDTAVRANAPFVAIVGNDARWNAEHQIQLRMYGEARAIGCDLRPTRYDAVATALGGRGELVTDRSGLIRALEAALHAEVPTCLNVMIESFPAPVVK